MKNILLLSIFLVSLCTSCENALTEEPTTFYSEETVFSTEEGIETVVNGMYSQLSAPDYYGSSWHLFLTPVSGKFFSTQVAMQDAIGLNTNSNNPRLSDLWKQAFKTINTANIIIANLEGVGTEFSNSKSALANAYFMRGMLYLDLIRLFGDVPLRVSPTGLDDIHAPRTERAQIIDVIIADLEKAKTMMPSADEAPLGRPGRLAANVYLAKLYMTLAGEDGGDAAFWAKAQAELMPVMDGTYSLTSTYAELFEPDNENTSESIFEIQYGQTGGQRNSEQVRSYMPSNSTYLPASIVTFGRIRPNKEVFDEHVATYPEDPRIDATYIFDVYEKNDGSTQKIYPDKTTGKQAFPLIRKWIDPAYNGTTQERNYILLRYADVLLMAAEIENEINGPDAAYSFVNQVLTRARDIDGDGVDDTTSPADWTALSQDEFRTRILDERRFELLSEGQEWFDTRRRGFAYFLQEVVNEHNTHSTFDATTDYEYPSSEKNMLLPIPLDEISGNTEVSPSDQNPGY